MFNIYHNLTDGSKSNVYIMCSIVNVVVLSNVMKILVKK